MKDIILFIVVCCIQGTLLEWSGVKTPDRNVMSLLNYGLLPRPLNPTRLNEHTQVGQDNLRSGAINPLNRYGTSNQVIGYNNQQSKPYYPREIYENYGNTGGLINKIPYDKTGNRVSNPNNWFETNNLDTSGDTDTGIGLGIFTSETTPVQLSYRGVNFDNFDNAGGNGLHVTTVRNALTDTAIMRGQVTTPSSAIEVVNSGNKIGRSKIYDVHINPRKDVLRVLISKELEYQAKPVVPENERNDSFKIIYYRE